MTDGANVFILFHLTPVRPLALACLAFSWCLKSSCDFPCSATPLDEPRQGASTPVSWGGVALRHGSNDFSGQQWSFVGCCIVGQCEVAAGIGGGSLMLPLLALPLSRVAKERHAQGLIEPACRRSPPSATLFKEGDGRAGGCARSAATGRPPCRHGTRARLEQQPALLAAPWAAEASPPRVFGAGPVLGVGPSRPRCGRWSRQRGSWGALFGSLSGAAAMLLAVPWAPQWLLSSPRTWGRARPDLSAPTGAPATPRREDD